MQILTTAASRALDRAAQERYAIPGIVLMENAARGMAEVAAALLRPIGRKVAVVCGPGNNGGDGYGVARHLANGGASVTIIPVGHPREGTDAATQARIAKAMGIPEGTLADLEGGVDLVVDALFGTGLDREVSGEPRKAIEAMNRCADRRVPILALDLPSGLDGDTGEPLGEAVRATVTAVTTAARPAMARSASRRWIGRYAVVLIGTPASLLQEFAKS